MLSSVDQIESVAVFEDLGATNQDIPLRLEAQPSALVEALCAAVALEHPDDDLAETLPPEPFQCGVPEQAPPGPAPRPRAQGRLR